MHVIECSYNIIHLVCSDIDKKFLDSVREFAPLFLAQDNLVVKEINGTPINGRGLLELFKVSQCS